jgi:hypothetical protein
MVRAALGKARGFSMASTAPGSDAFFALMKTWREAGDMRGLEVR